MGKKQFYPHFKSINETIANTPIDISRSLLSPIEIERIHKRYNIRTFSTRQEFDEAYYSDAYNAALRDAKMNPDSKIESVKSRLDKWYDYYEHREQLIATGQYDDIRAETYREQYLSHLRMANVDNDIIKNIENLTLDQWRTLYQQPDTDVSSIKDRELPSISNIYSYDSHTTDAYKQIGEEIRQAFKSAGLEFKEYGDKQEDNKVLMRRKFSKYAEAVLDGRIKLTNKADGSISVPFIGNTKGKNADVANDFIDYLEEIAEDFGY